ncbi:MAG: efflux RND transporter periplasmic adaptor subunit, partial [Kiloniellales bacterium]|nr:efflux RND transporter periplasmic adaptor subunit [Kiloniellales bacterium]
LLLCSVIVGPSFTSAEAETEMSVEKQITEVFVCPMHPEVRQAEPGLCPICGMALVPETASEADQDLLQEKPSTPVHTHTEATPIPKTDALPVKTTQEDLKGKIYICPMHPQFRSSESGSCPICAMDLVALEDTSETLPPSHVPGFATIKIDPRQQWLIGVKTAEVVRKNLTRQLRTVGTVAYDPGLYVAQKEYLEALKTGRSASSKSLIEAVYRKLILLGMSPEEIKKLENQGTVDESLFLTSGTGKAWIYSVIYESERPLLRKGLAVRARTVGHPQMQYRGQIDAITPVVNPMNRTIQVRSQVTDPHGLLQPDMFVDVYIEIPLGDALTIPNSAVLQTGLRNVVLLAKGEGIFEPRDVTLGNQTETEIQVVSGLDQGDVVVSSANFLLDSESQLRGAFESLGSGHVH